MNGVGYYLATLFHTGDLYILKYSFPRDVDEIHDYQLVTKHFLSVKDKQDPGSGQNQVYSVSNNTFYYILDGASLSST